MTMRTPTLRQRLALYLTPLLLAAVADPCMAQSACSSIRFERGASAAKVRGNAPADGVDCFRFGAGDGQDVQLSVRSDKDAVALSVVGVADDRQSLSFKTTKRTYEVHVFQTMKAAAPAPYELGLSIR
jgi:hypothetical protein